MDCSIIISTRNRADKLHAALRAFEKVAVPKSWRVEMIIADNGSTDITPDIISHARLPFLQVRGIREPQPGKSRALNAALATADGTALLFTDDDVIPAANWLERMATPLLQDRCDAVAGRVRLAPELQRPWLTVSHAMWLAERPEPAETNPELVGASMGIRREVFEQIPGFDVDLGPGITGLGEDTLLWMQMVEYGMRVQPVRDTEVVHQPDASRLNHASWVSASRQMGMTYAYLWHHWKHLDVSNLLASEYWHRIKLSMRILLERGGRRRREGCPEWELFYRTRIYTCQACRELSGTPRKYPPPADRARTSRPARLRHES